MKKFLAFAAFQLAVVAAMLCSCNKNEIVPDSQFQEAAKCSSAVHIAVADPDTRVTSTINANDGYTATSISNTPLSGNAVVIVGYHGINGVQKGMVQIINQNDGSRAIKSEIDVLDARVNTVRYCKYNGRHYAVIGVDRNARSADGKICGVIIVEINSECKFVVDETTLNPYYVSGISVNSIAWPNNSEVIFTAAGGNEALGDDGLAGFTKFALYEDEGKLKLSELAKREGTNYRGYCINYDDNANGVLTYTYRTVEGSDLVWKVGAVTRVDKSSLTAKDATFLDDRYNVEAEVYRAENTTSNYGKFSVTSTYVNGKNWIITSAGAGGVKIYHHNKTIDDNNFENDGAVHTLDLKAHIEKNCVSSSLYASSLFCAMGTSCYKYSLTFDAKNLTVDVKTVGRVKGDWPSVNYVSVNGKQGYVYVAAGESGLVRYKCSDNSSFTLSKDDPDYKAPDAE